MNHLMKKLVHPGREHNLYFAEGNLMNYKNPKAFLVPLSQTCHKCKEPLSRDCYYCKIDGCDEYYLHKECVELKDLPQEHHVLHPQHPLAIHYNYPHFKTFECSFCGKTTCQSRWFYRCSEEQCDFYLDRYCRNNFIKRPELLDKYEIQHFLHDHENHRLSPYAAYQRGHYFLRCDGCGFVANSDNNWYKCTGCFFFIQVKCSQVPKEVLHHYSHPQHALVLLQTPRRLCSFKSQQLRCIACLKWMENEFYLHCNHCPTFILDLQCYFLFQTEPTVKHEAHEHPLAYFQCIYDKDVRCYACNTPCGDCVFRCFTCNFNIHSDCLALPNTVHYYDHVHPLTLTTSFKEDEHPTAYYCDICEKKRDPDHGIYLCEKCPFIAHFECALSLSIAGEAAHAHAHAPRSQKLSDKEDQEDMTLTNEKVCIEILDQLNEEIKKVREVIEQIFIKKRGGEQPTEKLQEFEERRANTEDMLKRLKHSVTATEPD